MKDLSVHFSSKTDMWSTPQDLFDKLEEQYGGFSLDVCASRGNAKCRTFFTCEGLVIAEPGAYVQVTSGNGLNSSWLNEFGDPQTCWMNPPYGREIGKWIKKAFEESVKGCTVVCLLPARTDTKWFHSYIYNMPNVELTFLKGRLKFGDSKNAAPFPSMIVVFRSSK